jgi:hypothetical protein
MAVAIPRGGLKIEASLKHSLSASIARYRYQAKYFNGQPDGKIEAVPRETKRFQAITSAGDY